MDVPNSAIHISQPAVYDIRKGITRSHLEGFDISLVGGRVGRSLLQLSENGLILALSLGPSWNNRDLTDLFFSHPKFSICVTSKNAQISLSLCCLQKKTCVITLPMSF